MSKTVKVVVHDERDVKPPKYMPVVTNRGYAMWNGQSWYTLPEYTFAWDVEWWHYRIDAEQLEAAQ